MYYFNSNAFDDVKRVVTIFYSSDEVVAAKKALWAECDALLGPYPDRKTSDKRPAIIPHIDDIIEAIKTLDTLNEIPNVVARNIDRLPDRQPKVINLLTAIQHIEIRKI